MPAPQPVNATKQGAMIPVAGSQMALAVTSGAAVALTVPKNAAVAFITVETAPIRWRDDGTAPTTANGQLVQTNAGFWCFAPWAIQLIAVSTSAAIDVSYYQ